MCVGWVGTEVIFLREETKMTTKNMKNVHHHYSETQITQWDFTLYLLRWLLPKTKTLSKTTQNRK